MREPVRACEPCGGETWEPTPYRDVIGTGADLVRCTTCGCKSYSRTVLDARTVNDSPAAHLMAEETACYGAMNNRDPARVEEFRTAHLRYYGEMLRQLSALGLPMTSRLYEVGCGVGEFLSIAAAYGNIVAGCDPNSRAAELATARAGGPVEAAFFAEAHAPAEVDCVVMLDVLEHTETPRADLERARAMLRPGGLLLVKTFYDEWHETIAGGVRIDGGEGIWTDPRRGYFDPYGHLHHFDEPVLRALIVRAGFDVERWDRDTAYGQITCYARRP